MQRWTTWLPAVRKGGVTHDEIMVRVRKNSILPIPQAERYTSRDWFRTLLSWSSSVILRRIAHPVTWLTAWSVIIVCIDNMLPGGFPIVSSKGHVLLGSALSLLLVFRTNAAYSRFQFGRRIWERVTAVSRNTARLVACSSKELGAAKTQRLAGLLCAFPFLLREHVLGRCTNSNRLLRLLESLLDNDALEGLEQTHNRPLHVLDLMSSEVRDVPIQPLYESRDRINFYSHISRLAETVASCECLVQTPVPLHYTRHTTRFLSMFMLSLPLVLVSDYGVLTIPVVAFIAWAFFGIQEIGLWIEEPFRVLRLRVICNTIGADMAGTIYGQAILPSSTPGKAEERGANPEIEEWSNDALVEYDRLMELFLPSSRLRMPAALRSRPQERDLIAPRLRLN